jgi:Lrp/AsnC family transcriptional regulator for asnA, asnC and gidA
MIDDIEGVYRTETMISLEESINDKKAFDAHYF